MPENINGKTYSFDVCSKCQTVCCQDANPPLTEERKRIIKNYLQEQGLPFENVFVQGSYAYPASDEKGFCVFYDKSTKECSVHPVKPETCKAGPITFDINLQKRRVEWFLKKASICMVAPNLKLSQSQFAEHFEVAKEEITRLICSLEAEELLSILKIPEPETVMIGENELPKAVVQKLKIT
jgi:hypothetical protein